MFKRFFLWLFCKSSEFVVNNKLHKPPTSYIRAEMCGCNEGTKVSLYFSNHDDAMRFYSVCMNILGK